MWVLKDALGIFVGFVTVVASSIVLSLFSLAIFSGLLTEDAPLDVLTTSTGPLVYALFALFIAVIVGVFVSSRMTNKASIFHAAFVVVVYGLFSYWISQSPSNLEKMYPDWFVIGSYIILVPGGLLGYLLSRKVLVDAK